MAQKPVTVTSALPYANGPIHIGHLAGAYLPADIFVRYMRLKKEDVVFICGSDEHGVPITLRARNEGKSPQNVVDFYHTMNKKSFEGIGISFDIYHRTSSKLHHETAADFFTHLHKKNLLEEKESEQYYDPVEKTFLADRYIKGTCPSCGFEEAYGDQCEKCGTSLSPDELINPRSAISGEVPVRKKTTHWYIPLDKIQEEWLEEWIKTKKYKPGEATTSFKSHVYGQCMSWLNQGLNARAVTRDLDWGVKVPLKNSEGKVLYVWFDAPIGYISATKALLPDDWEKYWKTTNGNNPRLIHFIGKDNIVFHCIIFPAMLKMHGDYVLPENVPANEFMNLQGGKISTSRNWAVWLHEYLDNYPGKEDVLRYCLIANMPENKDSEFTWEDFQNRNNSELLSILGNFINRIQVLTGKYYDFKVPEVSDSTLKSFLEENHPQLILSITESPDKIGKFIESYNFKSALNAFMDFVRSGNKFLTDEEPWKLQKTDPEKTKVVLFTCIQLLARYAITMHPFLPFTAKKVFDMLGLDEAELTWDSAKKEVLVLGNTTIKSVGHLFSPIEDETIQKEIAKLSKKENTSEVKQEDAKSAEIKAAKEEVTFDEFVKIDLRVGQILTAEKVKKADKLLQFEVDMGFEKRTIVSGIAAFFKPEELINKKVVVVSNLSPRKIRGVESKGMILMAESPGGDLRLVEPAPGSNPGDTVL
ncbi:MAG: methionine--tRNA ligase [Chitinophagaceae bacterium]|nr:MAG: methionine--tRNA ligase [Chitinophagaceae bacterium]